jgi:hypothetical protein
VTKIVITLQDTADGGTFIKVDPGVPELMEKALRGEGTSAETYALAAYRAMHDRAMLEAAGGRQFETGEIPPEVH